MLWSNRLCPRADHPSALGTSRPIIGGLRHRPELAIPIPDGNVVRLLCGLEYQAGRRRNSPHIYDCHTGDDVYAEREEQS
jgi:hypothetical protein